MDSKSNTDLVKSENTSPVWWLYCTQDCTEEGALALREHLISVGASTNDIDHILKRQSWREKPAYPIGASNNEIDIIKAFKDHVGRYGQFHIPFVYMIKAVQNKHQHLFKMEDLEEYPNMFRNPNK